VRGEWKFPDYPPQGVYARNTVCEDGRGWEAFEPRLSRIENMDEDAVWSLTNEIPPEWHLGS